MKRCLPVLLLCTWTLVSQHHSSDGLWWRGEAVGVSEEACRGLLKKATTREKVGVTKWYAITPQHLEKVFGYAATPDAGTWIACWPQDVRFGDPDQ